MPYVCVCTIPPQKYITKLAFMYYSTLPKYRTYILFYFVHRVIIDATTNPVLIINKKKLFKFIAILMKPRFSFYKRKKI